MGSNVRGCMAVLEVRRRVDVEGTADDGGDDIYAQKLLSDEWINS